uniref:Uncharacterized protein n=1 Tax=Picea sitchensis TaxID=3332 RepID=A9P2D2_PICSI|nr:unknown [Picea sitchensis]
MMTKTLLFLLFSVLYSKTALGDHGKCKSWLVQSIPTDMPELSRVPGVLSSGDVLQWLAGNSSSKLDIIAQYWQLLAQPQNPKSGDYGYSAADLERFGAPVGEAVFKSLENAADRNVSIRKYRSKRRFCRVGRKSRLSRTLRGCNFVKTKCLFSILSSCTPLKDPSIRIPLLLKEVKAQREH